MKLKIITAFAIIPMINLLFAAAGYTQPVMLAEDVSHFAVLSDTDVLLSDRDGNFRVVDVTDPDGISSWDPGWDPADSGWERATTLVSLTVSPDGNWVCFTRFVAIPDELLLEDEYAPWPLAVVISPFYGNRAWLAALAMEVGGGPDFDFTMNSMDIYGQPFIDCETGVEDYLAWFRGENGDGSSEYFTKINLLSGERTGGDIFLGDGYSACPYSDLLAIDDWWLYSIADISTCETVLEIPQESGEFEVEGWVSEDALLVGTAEGQALLYSDGTIVENPNDYRLTVYCRMPQGAYLFSTDGGEEVLFGNMDWDRFQSLEAASIPDLSGELSQWDSVLPMQDGSGIVYHSSRMGGLVYFPIPSR